MLKVGDYISTIRGIAVPTNPFGRCKYCNNLSRPTKEQGNTFRGVEVRLRDLLDENWNRECQWCGILLRCIKMLEPETLQMVETSPERPMWCVINRHNAISICWNYTHNVSVIERCSFQLYRSPSTEPLSDGLDIPTCPELAPEPGHELMWDHLRQCLMKCLWSHSECRKFQQLDWFPKRLLYLESTGRPASNMRIVHTDEHHPSGPYIALSHCWGRSQPLRSLTTNIATFQEHIDIDQLSAVFKDCVTVAKKFGVNYIWIDSLCIIQDNRADWNKHAQLMDRIFENAIFVVAAVSSQDGSVPFLGHEAPNKRYVKASHPVDLSPLPGTLGNVRARCFGSSNANLTDVRGPLRYRAWAWQEHILSTRIIHFTETQSIWECEQAQGCEMMGSLEPRDDAMRTRISSTKNRFMWQIEGQQENETTDSLEPSNDAMTTSRTESTEQLWQYAVHEYGKKVLTYPSDRLPAFSGVAARFQPLFESTYCAGFWRNRIISELAWERSDILSLMSAELIPSPDNSVPSWSWASIYGSPLYSVESRFSGVTLKYMITEIDCEPSTDNPLGEVREGSFVELRGEFVEARMITDERGFAVVVRDGFAPQLVMPDCRLIEETRTIADLEIPTIRRALPSERFEAKDGDNTFGDKEAQEIMSGTVICLLLFVGTLWESNIDCGVVLILAPYGPDILTLQRVGLGRGGPDKSETEGSSIPWKWTNYETWENWEAWFDGAKTITCKVV